MTFDEVDLPWSPSQVPRRIELHDLSCRRTRAINVCSICLPREQALEAWQAEPPPTFPFLESQCQRAPHQRRVHFASDGLPPAGIAPRAAWARVIWGGLTQVKP